MNFYARCEVCYHWEESVTCGGCVYILRTVCAGQVEVVSSEDSSLALNVDC